MMRVHRWTGARLHLVFDLEHLATVGRGVHTEERQQLARAVVDRARVVPLSADGVRAGRGLCVRGDVDVAGEGG
jgi:hypothetical protein